MPSWQFLTNHAVVLLHVSSHPDSTLREISAAAGLTERAVIAIIRSLEKEGVVSHSRKGRNNVYEIDFPAVMKHLKGQTQPLMLEEIAALAAELAEKASQETTD